MKTNLLKKILLALVVVIAGGFLLLRYVLTPAEFKAQANPALACKVAAFDKSALVFDTLLICGTNQVSAEKLAYAANVAAEWLDNDGDGMADEPRLIETMKGTNPTVIMSGNGIAPAVMPQLMLALRGHALQDLGAGETNPSGGGRDASQEEIHHVIMNGGWQSLYPATFSETTRDNSTLYQAWKFADDNQHYVYNDPTCNSSCKVTEFVYLATAAYMEEGAEADLASDEMRLKTRAELAETIPAVIDIFESADYVYPTNVWPDGTYEHPDNISITIGGS